MSNDFIIEYLSRPGLTQGDINSLIHLLLLKEELNKQTITSYFNNITSERNDDDDN